MKSLITATTLSLALLGAQTCMAEESRAFVAFHAAISQQAHAAQSAQAAAQQPHGQRTDKAAHQG